MGFVRPNAVYKLMACFECTCSWVLTSYIAAERDPWRRQHGHGLQHHGDGIPQAWHLTGNGERDQCPPQ